MALKQKIIAENTVIAENILIKIFKQVRVGMALRELYQIAEHDIEKNDVVPSSHILGYDNFPMSIAINDRVFFDKESKIIKNGDLVKLALGLFRQGYFTDIGFSFIAGKNQEDNKISKRQKLIRGTAKALIEAIGNTDAGVNINKISNKIKTTLSDFDLQPIPIITGHGIGKNLHEQPVIPNTDNLPFINYSYSLKQGEIICIEIITTTGNGKIKNKDRLNYDIVTDDREPVAHYEIPILVKKKHSIILASKIYSAIKNIAVGMRYFD
jgi:methionyl aminopeptidase